MSQRRRTSSPSAPAAVVVCTIAYGALGWMLNGLGSVLPPLREQVGPIAGLYPLIPGVAMLTSALALATRDRAASGSESPAAGGDTRPVVVAFVALAGAMLLLGVSRPAVVSMVGMVGVAGSAAALARLVPGVLASTDPGRTTHLLMRANGVSSAAGVVAPLAVGAAIAVSVGWRVGFVGPVVAGAAVVVTIVRLVPSTAATDVAPTAPEAATAAISTLVVPAEAARGWIGPAVVLTSCIVVEFCFTYFAATYLSEELGLSNAAAAAGGAAWGVGMATGRFVSDASRASAATPRLVLITVGFGAMWIVATPPLAIAGFAIAGFGAAPLYPSRLAVLMGRFPRSPQRGATYGLLCSGIALVTAPALMAGLRAGFDVRTAYLLVPVMLAVLAIVASLDPAS
ncbi:MAG: MFS transporter [Desertimonas sp.]